MTVFPASFLSRAYHSNLIILRSWATAEIFYNNLGYMLKIPKPKRDCSPSPFVLLLFLISWNTRIIWSLVNNYSTGLVGYKKNEVTHYIRSRIRTNREKVRLPVSVRDAPHTFPFMTSSPNSVYLVFTMLCKERGQQGSTLSFQDKFSLLSQSGGNLRFAWKTRIWSGLLTRGHRHIKDRGQEG